MVSMTKEDTRFALTTTVVPTLPATTAKCSVLSSAPSRALAADSHGAISAKRIIHL